MPIRRQASVTNSLATTAAIAFMAVAAGCTSGTSRPAAAPAGSVPASATPGATLSAASSDGTFQYTYLSMLRLEGKGMEQATDAASALTTRSDADLNTAGQSACTALRAGTSPLDIYTSLEGSGYTLQEAASIVVAAVDRQAGLCADQWKTLNDFWRRYKTAAPPTP